MSARLLLLFLTLLLALAPAAIAQGDPCALPGAEPLSLGGDDSGIGSTGRGGDDSGIGGTGRGGDDSGIGGTGRGGDDSGIGGTGRGGDDSGIGGTGIFGTVTGTGGGLCVNGAQVGIDASTGVTVRGLPGSAAELAVGQVVWVRATSRGDALHAESIAVYSAAFGPITRVDPARRRIQVGSHAIEVPEHAALFAPGADRAEGFDALVPGMVVAVSALPTPGGIFVATRVDRERPERRGTSGLPDLAALVRGAPGLARLSAEGHVFAQLGPRTLRLDGLEIELPERPSAPERLAPSERIWVSGALADRGVLRVERLQVRPVVRPPELLRPTLEPRELPATKPPQKPAVPEPIPRPPERPEPIPRPPERPEPIPRPPERPPVIDRLDRPEPILRLEPARD